MKQMNKNIINSPKIIKVFEGRTELHQLLNSLQKLSYTSSLSVTSSPVKQSKATMFDLLS